MLTLERESAAGAQQHEMVGAGGRQLGRRSIGMPSQLSTIQSAFEKGGISLQK